MKTRIIVDLEATCCDKNSFPRNEMEVIEIGAVAIQDKSFYKIDEYQSFISPVINPVLTTFCRKLTSISQSDVDSAPLFDEVISDFKIWVNKFENPVFCSWGYFDKNILLRECRVSNSDFPFDHRHINMKKSFAKKAGLKRGIGLGKALNYSNIEFEGTAHRGIDDARNMAKLAKFVFKDD